ncbi:hypothetical protein NBRC116601_31080 [Cognatishimia sp. WU-CL00825]
MFRQHRCDFRHQTEKPSFDNRALLEFYQLFSCKVDLEAKLDEWEWFYNFARPHGARNGQTPCYNKGVLVLQTLGNHEIRYDYHITGGVQRERHKVDSRELALENQFNAAGGISNQKLPYQPGTQNTQWEASRNMIHRGGFGMPTARARAS